MTALPTEDAWMEKVFLTISLRGGSEVQFAPITETIEISGGEKDIEGVALVNGGRLRKWSPQSDFEIKFEAYPLGAGTASSGTTAEGFYDMLYANSQDTTSPQRFTTDYVRNLHRIVMLWTNDTSVSSAISATTDTFYALRLAFAECVFTSVQPSFTDGILKFTVTAKCTPFDKSGSPNWIADDCRGASGSDVVPALAAYTTSNKFA